MMIVVFLSSIPASLMHSLITNSLPSFSTAIASRLRHSITLTVMKVLPLYHLSNERITLNPAHPSFLTKLLARGGNRLRLRRETNKQAQGEHAERPRGGSEPRTFVL